jgi:hypothetical protein
MLKFPVKMYIMPTDSVMKEYVFRKLVLAGVTSYAERSHIRSNKQKNGIKDQKSFI